MAGNSSSMDASSARVRIVARYDSLLEALGEDPFHPTSALQRAEDAAKVVDDAQTAAQRKKLLAAAAQKSLRCAELIEQALGASAALSDVQRKIVRAHKAQQNDDGEDADSDASSEDDDDVDMDNDDTSSSNKTALLLEDLVAVGDEMQDVSKKYAHLGVADKTARASRKLLSLADQSLHESVEALATGAWDGSSSGSHVQNEFRDLYMDAFTSAFGDDLDQFRQEERFESRDVSYLISCIHAGGDVFTPLQKTLFVESMSANK